MKILHNNAIQICVLVLFCRVNVVLKTATGHVTVKLSLELAASVLDPLGFIGGHEISRSGKE
jgi:hypothetical protein